MENKYNFDRMSFDELGAFIDHATEREEILYQIYEEEPETFNEQGKSILSPEACRICTRTTVYIGPDIGVFDTGRCLFCGELHN